jgi:hypothetical protein
LSGMLLGSVCSAPDVLALDRRIKSKDSRWGAEIAESRELAGMRWRVECRPQAFDGRGLKARILMMDFADVVLGEGLARLEQINPDAACQVREEFKKRPFVLKCEGRTGNGSAVTVPRVAGALRLDDYRSNIIAPEVVRTLLENHDPSGGPFLLGPELASAKNTLFHEMLHAAGVENKSTHAHNQVHLKRTVEEDVTYSCANVIFPDLLHGNFVRKEDGKKGFVSDQMCVTCTEYQSEIKGCREQPGSVERSEALAACRTPEVDPRQPLLEAPVSVDRRPGLSPVLTQDVLPGTATPAD